MSEETVTVKNKSSVTLACGLSLSLTSFSHKRPVQGGATKATAYVTAAIETEGLKEDIMLSIHGQDGDPSVKHYDTLKWRGFSLELMPPFEYDRSITVKVKSPLVKERLL